LLRFALRFAARRLNLPAFALRSAPTGVSNRSGKKTHRFSVAEAQVGQAVEAVLKQIGQTTNPYALPALAQALQALAGKLSGEQAVQASKAAAASLAWAAKDDDAVEWAHALVALSHGAADQDGKLTARSPIQLSRDRRPRSCLTRSVQPTLTRQRKKLERKSLWNGWRKHTRKFFTLRFVRSRYNPTSNVRPQLASKAGDPLGIERPAPLVEVAEQRFLPPSPADSVPVLGLLTSKPLRQRHDLWPLPHDAQTRQGDG
jgi:hypothetical protein